MTDNVVIALVGAVATVGVSLVNAVFSWLGNSRGKRNENHLIEAKEAVAALQVQTDGMQDKLLQVTSDSSRAQGVIEGAAAEKCRFKGDDAVCKFPAAGAESKA